MRNNYGLLNNVLWTVNIADGNDQFFIFIVVTESFESFKNNKINKLPLKMNVITHTIWYSLSSKFKYCQ